MKYLFLPTLTLSLLPKVTLTGKSDFFFFFLNFYHCCREFTGHVIMLWSANAFLLFVIPPLFVPLVLQVSHFSLHPPLDFVSSQLSSGGESFSCYRSLNKNTSTTNPEEVQTETAFHHLPQSCSLSHSLTWFAIPSHSTSPACLVSHGKTYQHFCHVYTKDVLFFF